MAKKNIGATLALYPSPVIVVGAMVNGKPTWTLVAHAGTVAHSHLMVSLVQAHYINKGIRENGKLSVNVVDESWLKQADKMGTISGSKVDKSGMFAWTMGENGAPLIDGSRLGLIPNALVVIIERQSVHAIVFLIIMGKSDDHIVARLHILLGRLP